MKLFRRLLYALFPKDMFQQGINPAGVFISFISPKQFFSVIVRRIVENYKLNLFDICLDSFEAKIGFGSQPALQVKDVDFYYGYTAAANLNGWQFLAPSTIAMSVTLVTSIYIRPHTKKRQQHYFIATLLTVYMLFFVFIARIKVIPPDMTPEEQFQWFVELFFSTQRVIMEQSGKRFQEDARMKYKESLLQQIQIFFMLFQVYQHVQTAIASDVLSPRDVYHWLFYDQLKKPKEHMQFQKFILQATTYTYTPSWWGVDTKVMESILPADFLPKYIFLDPHALTITDHLIEKLYNRDELDQLLQKFLPPHRHPHIAEEFIGAITAWKTIKWRFFVGLRNLTQQLHRARHHQEVTQEIEKFMEELGENDSLEGVNIPEALKQESVLMEKILNFYMSYMGGSRTARGDNFFLRLWRKPMLQGIVDLYDPNTLQQDALSFYGWLLYNYSKNMFYYTYAFDNVKAGREKFQLPFTSSLREVYSNMHILKLFDEHFVATTLQDLNTKTLKIFIRDQEILRIFKNVIAQDISKVIAGSDEEVIHEVYGPALSLLQKKDDILACIVDHVQPQDITALKDNVYTVDLRVRIIATRWLQDNKVNVSDMYGDMSIMGMVSVMRETLFGCLLYLRYLRQQTHTQHTGFATQELKKIYITDVLNVGQDTVSILSEMIEDLLTQFTPLLDMWIATDDNPKFFAIGKKNREDYITMRDTSSIVHDVQGEDALWLRWYLKNITYYNKRYLIPRADQL